MAPSIGRLCIPDRLTPASASPARLRRFQPWAIRREFRRRQAARWRGASEIAIASGVLSLKLTQREGGKIEMEDHDIRAALDRHGAASDANDFEAEHQIYREDAVLEYPQPGGPSRGRGKIQSSRPAQPTGNVSQCGG